MAGHTISLCTYDRGLHPLTGKVQPYHWAFFIQIRISKKKNIGIVHQLRGMPGAFYYKGAEDVANLWKSETLKQDIPIGEVDDADLDKIEAIFQSIPIDKSESSGWNCQSWSLEGLAKLQQEGFIYDSLTGEGVYEWLKEPDDMPASEDPAPGDEEATVADSSYHASSSANDGGKKDDKKHSGVRDKGKEASHHASSSAHGSSSVDDGGKKDGKKTHSGARDKGKKASHHASSSAHASSATDDGHDLGFGSLSIQGTTPWSDGWYEDPWTNGTGTTQRYFEDGVWTDYTR